MENPPGPFRHLFPLDYDSLVQVLVNQGYTEANLESFLDGNDLDLDRPVLLRRAAENSPFHQLVKLFSLGERLTVEAARSLFQPVEFSSLVTSGILIRDDNQIRASTQLVPISDFFVFSDFVPSFGCGPMRRDHVLGTGQATATLASLTPRRIFRSALDLGAGCGIQSLRAARHCSHVTGTDVNPRALNFAAMNAHLNRISNVQFREGSFFEPLDDSVFDLIVSNPPFVISPEERFIFCDGEEPSAGDASELVVRNAPRYLAEGGLAIILINWSHDSEDDWAQRPRDWVEANGCDHWLLRFRSADPLTYAADWLRPIERRNSDAYGARLDEWLAYYKKQQINRLSAGAMILHKRNSRTHWSRSDTVPYGRHTGHCGGQIERVVAAETLMSGFEDDCELLNYSLCLHPDHAIRASLTCVEGDWERTSLELRPSAGMTFAGEVDTVVMGILARCDDTLRLRDILKSAAVDIGGDAEQFTAISLGLVKKLLKAGFFVAKEGSSAATDLIKGN